MAHPAEAELDPAAYLERHAEEIASACTEAIQQLPDSHYQTTGRGPATICSAGHVASLLPWPRLSRLASTPRPIATGPTWPALG